MFHKIDSFVLLRQKKTKVAFSEILSLRRILPEVCELLHFQLQGNISIFLRSTLSGKNDFQTSIACGEELQVGWPYKEELFRSSYRGLFSCKIRIL
ncbi:hypothetical protein DLM78_16810 [Leptospira stimsonii]|uniref:Uncharacterized protein n=1 Tax=Leptospira stimsonii TaxID=2202203 RepID=A0A8B3CMP8_9LEPT|nr:hypothetical protein DLM78_16810 [Leptospira stimsonii]